MWAFNDENLARAIFASKVPTISAVGHETDYTIADFVADLRAPTPSAAAELAVYDVRQVLNELYGYKDRLARCILTQVEYDRDHLDSAEARLRYLNPQNQILQKRQYMLDLEDRIQRIMTQFLKDKKHLFALLAGRLDAMSPLKRLASGYAYVADEQGGMVDSVKQIKKNDILTMTLVDGCVRTQVEEVLEQEENPLLAQRGSDFASQREDL